MTTTPQLRIQTVDTSGDTDEMTLETLLELLKPMLPAPVAPPPVPPGAVEKMDFRKVAAEHVLDLDAFSQHFVNAAQPCTVTFATKAAYNEVVSAQVEVIGAGVITFAQPVIWHTAPRKSGSGLLTVRRSSFAGKDLYRLAWSPEVK